MSPDFTFVDYDSGRDGQIAVGTITLVSSDGTQWFDATGIDSIELRGAFAGGTTTITVEQSREGGSSAALVTDSGITSATVAGVGGAVVVISYQFVRIKIVQTVATTTNAQLAVKGKA